MPRTTWQLLLAAVLPSPAVAQSYGSGLGKTTYSVSDAVGCWNWMLTYLPTAPDMDGCVDGIYCPCGQTGRVRLATSAPPAGGCYLKYGVTGVVPAPPGVHSMACVPNSGGGCNYTLDADLSSASGSSATADSMEACCAACRADAQCEGSSYVAGSPSGMSQGFGLHTVHVNASSPRPYGKMSNVEVEKSLDTKLAAALAGGGYDAFMDFTSGHWVASLEPYVAAFTAGKTPFIPLRWADTANGKEYYSVIVRVHTSMLLIELMSDTCQRCAAAPAAPLPRYFFAKGQSPADVFGALDDGASSRPLLHAARVSWPTSSLARDRKYYIDALQLKVLKQASAGDVSVDAYDFTPFNAEATMQFHIVQRPSGNTTGAPSVAEWEAAMTACHASAMKDDVCGFDQWLDNHIGVSAHGSAWDLGRLQAVAEGLGLRYHVLNDFRGGGHNVYMAAPNGLAIQFAGLGDGNYTPSRDPGEQATELCGIGAC